MSRTLREHPKRPVRLSFADGEVVEAVLLGVDEQRDQDLTYEVKRVVQRGNPPARGTGVGVTCVARLPDLKEWEALPSRS